MLQRYPSPLAGEGVIQRMTDEGLAAAIPSPDPPFGGHPLPQGEREVVLINLTIYSTPEHSQPFRVPAEMPPTV